MAFGSSRNASSCLSAPLRARHTRHRRTHLETRDVVSFLYTRSGTSGSFRQPTASSSCLSSRETAKTTGKRSFTRGRWNPPPSRSPSTITTPWTPGEYSRSAGTRCTCSRGPASRAISTRSGTARLTTASTPTVASRSRLRAQGQRAAAQRHRSRQLAKEGAAECRSGWFVGWSI